MNSFEELGQDDLLLTGQVVYQSPKQVFYDEGTIRRILAVDVARFGEDENAIAFNYYDAETKTSHIRVEILNSIYRTTHLAGKLEQYSKHRGFRKIIMDDQGVGAGVTDVLVERLGKRKVMGVANQRMVKEIDGGRKRYMHLMKLMETGKVLFDNDTTIVRSLRSMTYRYGDNNQILIKGSYTHAAEAIVRSVFPLLSKNFTNIVYIGAI